MDRQRPERVRIGGFTFPITYESKGNLENRLAGAIDHINLNIYITENAHIERQKEVLLHEVLHGIDDQIGADHVMEEENSARTQALFAFLREPRNRAAIEWIMSEGE